MKRLILMRHAEAGADGATDLERRLNERGVSTARLMGGSLTARGIRPQQVVSSNATRAVETATFVSQNADLKAEIVHDARIYEAAPSTLLAIVNGFPDEFTAVMVVGHNPGFEGFVSLLTGTIQSMRAGSVAVIDLHSECWRDIAGGSGNLTEILHP